MITINCRALPDANAHRHSTKATALAALLTSPSCLQYAHAFRVVAYGSLQAALLE